MEGKQEGSSPPKLKVPSGYYLCFLFFFLISTWHFSIEDTQKILTD